MLIVVLQHTIQVPNPYYYDASLESSHISQVTTEVYYPAGDNELATIIAASKNLVDTVIDIFEGEQLEVEVVSTIKKKVKHA